MSYVEGTLMKGEEILFFTHPHKIILAAPAVWFLIALAFTIFGDQISFMENVIFRTYSIYNLIVAISFLYSFLKLLNRLIEYRTSEYTVTNRRVVMKSGVLNRTALELMLNRLEAVTVQQPLFGQIFNYGMVLLVGIGGTRDAFKYVPRPMYFRQQIQTLRDGDDV